MAPRPLLYVDLMGFSKLVLEKDHRTILNLYNRIIGEKLIETDISVHQAKFDIVSDSLFVWTEITDAEIAIELLVQIGIRLFYSGIATGIPVRGSLVYDEFEIADNEFKPFKAIEAKKIHTILGKAIVKAVDWEKKQKWSGISIPPAELSVFRNSFPTCLANLITNNSLVEYPVPIKSSTPSTELTLAINGVIQSDDGNPHHAYENLKSGIEQLIRNNPGDQSILDKLNNTFEFISWVKTNNKYSDPDSPRLGGFKATTAEKIIKDH